MSEDMGRDWDHADVLRKIAAEDVTIHLWDVPFEVVVKSH